MLTIVNIERLFRMDVGGWRIGGIETLPNTYIIRLRKPNGEKHQVNIERNPIGNEYEMWCWKNVHHLANMVPERLMLTKDMLETMEKALLHINLLLI